MKTSAVFLMGQISTHTTTDTGVFSAAVFWLSSLIKSPGDYEILLVSKKRTPLNRQIIQPSSVSRFVLIVSSRRWTRVISKLRIFSFFDDVSDAFPAILCIEFSKVKQLENVFQVLEWIGQTRVCKNAAAFTTKPNRRLSEALERNPR